MPPITTKRLQSSKTACCNAAEFWLRSDWGQRLPELYEEVLFRRDGYAFILLWVEKAERLDDHDPEEDRTSKERLADRQARYSR
jgi:hypothetical protein